MKSIQKTGLSGVQLGGRQIQGTMNSHLCPGELRMVFLHEMAVGTYLVWDLALGLGTVVPGPLEAPTPSTPSRPDGVFSTEGHTHVWGGKAVRFHPQ